MNDAIDRIYIDLELFGLDEYFDLIQENIPRLLEDKRNQLITLSKLFKNKNQPVVELDGEQFDYEQVRVALMMDNSFPKVIWASYLVSLWSFFETTIKSLAGYALDNRLGENGFYFSFDDLAGDLLNRLKLVFNTHASFSIPLDWEKLKLIYKIRNIVVHGNSVLSQSDKKYLENNFTNLTGLEIFAKKRILGESESIFIDDLFCRWALDVIKIEIKRVTDELGI